MKVDIVNMRCFGRDPDNEHKSYIVFNDGSKLKITEEQFDKINEGLKEYNKRCEPFRSKIRRLNHKINKPYYIELTEEKENG